MNLLENEHTKKMKVPWRIVTGLPLLLVLLAPAASGADAGPKDPPTKDAKPQGDFIEDVNAKQLERMLDEKDYVAVFWCTSFFYLIYY